ncbi:hypothetical protein ES703_11710 [subsurface metagenome]
MHLLIYASRSKVVLTGDDFMNHYPPLWGKLITLLLQRSYYFFLRKPHLKLKMKNIIIYTIAEPPHSVNSLGLLLRDGHHYKNYW